MALQSSIDFFSHLLGPRQPEPKQTTLVDLDEYLLANIFKFVQFRDLVMLSATCVRLNRIVKSHLNIEKHLTYSCHINGLQIIDGHYHFNLAAFNFILQNMPKLQSLSFEKCQPMYMILATNQDNIIELIAQNLLNLQELHIGRSLALNESSIAQLIFKTSDLSHLSVEIYNENILDMIVKGFDRLVYLNLGKSIFNVCADYIKRFPSTIQTFIAPDHFHDPPIDIVDALCSGNGKNLKRFEFKFRPSSLDQDCRFFSKIGTGMNKLQWFACEIKNLKLTGVRTHYNDENGNVISDVDLQHRPEGEHRHIPLIQGLSGLQDLQVLILKEDDYFDKEDRCSMLDDFSMLEIIRSCPRLVMLSIACAIRCNKPVYHRYDFDTKENTTTVNRILAKHFSSKTEEDGEEEKQASKILSIPAPSWSEMHTISDNSLAHLSDCLPNLKILQLRGVCLGTLSFEAIASLQHLKCLRLDSIEFSFESRKPFTEFIARILDRANVRITNIPL